MSFVEDYNQYVRTINRLNDRCRAAFNKIQDARLLRRDDDEGGQILRDYTYKSFGHRDNVITLTGTQYVGGGEYDYVYHRIHISEIDNIDKWIKTRREYFFAEQRKRHAEKKEKRLADKAESERIRHELYLEMKKEFESDVESSDG